MTKETIIKSTLKYLVKRQIEEGSVGFAVDNDHDHDCCWDDVLAWIEAQPCENAVSREAVIKTIKEMSNANPSYTHTCDVVDRQDLIDSIDELPSVTPKYTDEEIDKAQAVEQAYVDKMVELAVEETKRPKGKWTYIGNSKVNGLKICECSVCEKRTYGSLKFCPNCGAEM